MSETSECWFNVYASGHRGMIYRTREDAEIAGTPSFVERITAGAVYRVHVTMKALAPPQSQSDGAA